MWVAYLIGSLISIDAICRWFKRFDVDIWEGDALPTRWLVWGTVRGGAPHSPYPGNDWRYFVLRLPSYGYEMHIAWDEYRWMQRALIYRGRFSNDMLRCFMPGWVMTFTEPLRGV